MVKVSVIIPVYNNALMLGAAADSVLAQTFKDYEIIVADDGSTDNIREITDRYAGRIKYIRQENLGVSKARNAGIKSADGEYIAFLDSDDTWLPDKLQKSLAFLEKGGFDWICTSRFKINERGEKSERKIETESGIYDQTGRMDKLEIGLYNYQYILAVPSTVVAKRKCFEIAGIFDESLKICEDLDLLLRFKEAGLIGGYLDEPLTIKLSHSKSLSRKNPIENLEYTTKVAKKHAKILRLNKFLSGKLYGEFWWEIALSYYMNGSRWNAVKCSLMSLYFYPCTEKLTKILRYGLTNKLRR